jgi:thiamine-monophosphate kinase
VDEFQFIQKLNLQFKYNFSDTEIGPGDDAALVNGIPPGELLVSKDLLIENVHFDLNLSTAQDVGWKAIAVNESDICAMGGVVKGYLIGLGLPKAKQELGLKIYQGMNEYFNRPQSPAASTPIYGGDTVNSPIVIISVTVLGQSKKPIKRSGARPGDSLWISGPLGGSAMGLKSLKGDLLLEDKNKYELAHKRPVPMNELSTYLSNKNILTSMIDVSDGLFQDLKHLSEMSKVSFEVDFSKIPCVIEDIDEKNKIELVCGGEDYQLLFTAPSLHDEEIQSFGCCVKIGDAHELSDSMIFVKTYDNQIVPLENILKKHCITNIGYNHF